MKSCGVRYAIHGGRLLDIAPQDHEGAKPYFPPDIQIESFDIDTESGADIIGDICQINSCVAPSSYNFIVCTEVLEHVRQPFFAVTEIERMLAPGGYVFVSTPFNFRIHGPLPDCWRFTEHGLRELFQHFDIIELDALESDDRFLMPIHYCLVAQKRRTHGESRIRVGN